MKRHTEIFLLKWALGLMMALASAHVLADGPGARAPGLRTTGMLDVRFRFKRQELAGFETDRLQNRLETIEVRGWRVAQNAWFGQTRVAQHSGVGFVLQNGNTIYQLNNRGIQVTRYF